MRRTILFLTAGVCLPAPGAAENQTSVRLFERAGLNRDVIRSMQREASRIFEQAGWRLVWVECEIAGERREDPDCGHSLGAGRLMLELAPGADKQNSKATGMAIIQGEASVFARVYPERVRELARDAGWTFGDLLGHAVAHEIGHLLLQSAAHTSAGIMRARWETEDLRKLSHSGLIFLPGQLRSIRVKTAAQR